MICIFKIAKRNICNNLLGHDQPFSLTQCLQLQGILLHRGSLPSLSFRLCHAMFICQYWTPQFQPSSYLINLICYILTFVLLVTNKNFTYKRLKIITAEIIALTSEAMYLHYLYTSQHINKLACQTHLFLVKKCNTKQKKFKFCRSTKQNSFYHLMHGYMQNSESGNMFSP